MVQKYEKVYYKHRLLFLTSWQATRPFVFYAPRLLSLASTLLSILT